MNALPHDLPLWRANLLRAIYALIAFGQGSQVVPTLLDHDPAARGVIPSLLAAMCLLMVLGIRYPRQMLPLLLFECAWKIIWFFVFGLPQYLAGNGPPDTFAGDFFAISLGVVLMPLVIPWGYVWTTYIKAPAEPWRRSERPA